MKNFKLGNTLFRFLFPKITMAASWRAVGSEAKLEARDLSGEVYGSLGKAEGQGGLSRRMVHFCLLLPPLPFPHPSYLLSHRLPASLSILRSSPCPENLTKKAIHLSPRQLTLPLSQQSFTLIGNSQTLSQNKVIQPGSPSSEVLETMVRMSAISKAPVSHLTSSRQEAK